MPFSNLGLSPTLINALAEQNYTEAYPIQTQVIPAVLKGKDILGIAQTGSGKTASFVLPILEKLQHSEKSANRHINTLILVPTRELAIQVEKVVKLFSSYLPYKPKSMAVYGGVSINPQMIGMQGVEILVSTPGRLLELVTSKAVHLSDVKLLVLDEADKMLNAAFLEEMDEILALLPKKRQNLLFSATLSDDINTITKILLNDPVVIKIEADPLDINLITQEAYFVEEEKKGPLLRYLIKSRNIEQVLVFASSVYKADNIADKLRNNGIDAAAIHSKKSMGGREDVLNKFKNGTLRVLVATDLIARGIDIKFLPYVINYELPRSPKDYVHRIGRTGRAQSPGQAISFISAEEKAHFRVIQKKMGKWVTMIDSEGIDLKGY